MLVKNWGLEAASHVAWAMTSRLGWVPECSQYTQLSYCSAMSRGWLQTCRTSSTKSPEPHFPTLAHVTENPTNRSHLGTEMKAR